LEFHEGMDLSEELREQLGLDDAESIRVLKSGTRLLVLEKTGADTTIAVPWDRELVLEGDVRAFPLADLLSMLHGMGKSGFLYFCQPDCEKSVYLHRGEVIFAASNQRVDRLGNSLLHAGVITLSQLQEAEQRWECTGRFGKVLVERGLLSPRELWDGVKRQVEEVVRSLFAYTTGTFCFWEGEIQPDNVVRLSLPTKRLISEGLRRRDDLLRTLSRLEDSRMRLELAAGAIENCSSNDRNFLEEVASDGFFPGVCRRAGVDPLSGARMVQMLQSAGILRMVATEEASELTTAPVGGHGDDAVRECLTNYLKLVSELSSPIVAVEGAKGLVERLGRVVDELAVRYPVLLEGVGLGASGLLDADVLMERVLRHPGDRLRVIEGCMGELVSYLEFELRNHPRIEDPEVYLEAVEGLRANLP
jgi:hypothetical protein